MSENIDLTNERVARRKKLEDLRKEGINPYPNRFKRTHTIAQAKEEFLKDESSHPKVKTAGRLMRKRVMGKLAFGNIKDENEQIQIMLKKDINENALNLFKKMIDLGDILGVEGEVIRTKTGEITVQVRDLMLLSKSIEPMPEKFHGLQDVELRYRKRYLDLMINDDTRKNFALRSQMIKEIRRFLDGRGFLEVETPMMHPIPGGASARPFITHHNALDIDLYLRIAPELYLKRLIVGGFEKVYELGRNFRNEGISTKHNPEFTMVEMYQAYADYEDMMELCEDLLESVVKKLKGTTKITYQGTELDFKKPFQRVKWKDALKEFAGVDVESIRDEKDAREVAEKFGIEVQKGTGKWKILQEVFEETVEEKLTGPVFVYEFPTEISPLAKRYEDNPEFTERFELFIAGDEIANAFTELNDPLDQAERFKKQAEERAKGDDEAMFYDADYIEALSYAMPPTGGMGIGIDRLAMIMIDTPSIRDTILFPTLRPEKT